MNFNQNKFKTCKRYDVPGQAHVLSFNCFKNRPFLINDIFKQYMVEAINNVSAHDDIHVWSWVIMNNHVHLLIYPVGSCYSISDFLKSLKQSVARKAIRFIKEHKADYLAQLETGFVSPKYRFWQQGGGFDRNIRSLDNIRNIVEYIHENPVRKGYVDQAIDWDWSSARAWQGIGSSLVSLNLEYFPG
ncbi:MAG TPA: transposase [bacterium]